MSNGTAMTCPYWAPDEVRNDWPNWSSSRRIEWLSKNKKPKGGGKLQKSIDVPETGTVRGKNGTTASVSPSTGTLNDIREWNEDIDGIPAERIRNCILYQLDVAKSSWYRSVLSIGYLKRVRKDAGVSGARKLHEDTPPGWVPNPLIGAKKIPGTDDEVRYVAREPEKSEEWEVIHGMLVGARGKVNSKIAKILAKKDCPKCKGEGGYTEREHPNAKSIKLRFQEFYHTPCECCSINPFQQ